LISVRVLAYYSRVLCRYLRTTGGRRAIPDGPSLVVVLRRFKEWAWKFGDVATDARTAIPDQALRATGVEIAGRDERMGSEGAPNKRKGDLRSKKKSSRWKALTTSRSYKGFGVRRRETRQGVEGGSPYGEGVATRTGPSQCRRTAANAAAKRRQGSAQASH